MKFHPIADCFPLLEGKEFADFTDDVRERGVLQPIMLYQNQILDGRNRWRAAVAAGVDCPTKDYTGTDPIGFVTSLNLKRRHLNDGARAIAAEKLANLKHGSNQFLEDVANEISSVSITIPEAADLMQVSKASVDRARIVRVKSEELDQPEIYEAAKRGELRLVTAVNQLKKIAEAPLLREITAMPSPDELHAVRAQRLGLEQLTPEFAALVSRLRVEEIEHAKGLNKVERYRLRMGKTLVALRQQFVVDGYGDEDFWRWFEGKFYCTQRQAEDRIAFAMRQPGATKKRSLNGQDNTEKHEVSSSRVR